MKLTWTFFPKGDSAVTLIVIYRPELDGKLIVGGGVLDVPTNTAYVNWETFNRFNDASVASRKDAYSCLTRLTEPFDERLLVGRKAQ